MSYSGDSLADWQTIVEALNERIQAIRTIHQGGWVSLNHIPVPTSINHITYSFVSNLVSTIDTWITPRYTSFTWCYPDSPLIIVGPDDVQHWNSMYQTGTQIYDIHKIIPSMGPDDFHSSIYEFIPNYGSIPLRGAELEKMGDFLSWCDKTLKLMKVMAYSDWFFPNKSTSGDFRWNISTNEILNLSTGETSTATSFSDFYSYALTKLETVQGTGPSGFTPSCYTQVSTDTLLNVWLSLYYDTIPIYSPIIWTPEYKYYSTPGMVNADISVYYSSFGDNCGYPVNSSSTHISQSTINFQNVGPESSIEIGFDFSSISTIPNYTPSAGSSYERRESLSDIAIVWDFSNYFQYCV